METVNGVRQGGIMNLPLNFRSGLVRGRFHTDGHLYLCGLRVWQSNGVEYGALHRVRYTGRPMHLPLAMHARPNGIELRFSCKLDRQSATDPQNYSLEQWNYRWIGDYGSPHYSVNNPEEKGHDSVPIKAVHLADDQKTVLIEVNDPQPVMQMHIRYNVRAEDGVRLRQDIYNTIHRVP
jgi:hypothetical protein